MDPGVPAFLPPVEEQHLETESFPDDNPGNSAVRRVSSAIDTKADGMHGTVHLRPTGVENGRGIEGRVLLDTDKPNQCDQSWHVC